jgi:hypothetical protein
MCWIFYFPEEKPEVEGQRKYNEKTEDHFFKIHKTIPQELVVITVYSLVLNHPVRRNPG